jgi:hypothetical protein
MLANRSLRIVAASLLVVGLTGVGRPAWASGRAGGTAARPATSEACATLEDAIDRMAESLTAADRQSPSFVEIKKNGWTAFVPNDNQWSMTASDGGADINSTTGWDASLISWPSLDQPWTFTRLAAKTLDALTHVRLLCHTGVASSGSGQSEAAEYSGDLGRQPITIVLALSLPTATTETFFGISRYEYTPTSQWTVANVDTLGVIIRRAIFTPHAL